MLIVPGGLFMYGWAAEAQVYWLVPLIGACVFAFGMMITYVRHISSRLSSNPPDILRTTQISIQTYLVDSFQQYAASALAAIIVLRCTFGAIFTIFGAKLYEKLGYGW